jgi:hypothetical protein
VTLARFSFVVTCGLSWGTVLLLVLIATSL